MSTASFTEVPGLDWSREPVRDVVEFDFGGARQTAALQPVDRDMISWPMKRTGTEAEVVDAFMLAREQQVEAFYVTLPRPTARTSVSLGTATSNQTAFTMPTTGDESRDFPVNDAAVVVYDDAVSVAVSATSTDGRQFTLAAAPASNSVMTCDYSFYRLVKLAEPYRWAGLAPDWYETTLALKEVPE
jgi:hypothetical protein